jgi:hypothetical protein
MMYRALMLRGLACHANESKTNDSFDHDQPPPANCEKARQTLREIISGSALDPVYLKQSIDESIQHLALGQVLLYCSSRQAFCVDYSSMTSCLQGAILGFQNQQQWGRRGSPRPHVHRSR